MKWPLKGVEVWIRRPLTVLNALRIFGLRRKKLRVDLVGSRRLELEAMPELYQERFGPFSSISEGNMAVLMRCLCRTSLRRVDFSFEQWF